MNRQAAAAGRHQQTPQLHGARTACNAPPRPPRSSALVGAHPFAPGAGVVHLHQELDLLVPPPDVLLQALNLHGQLFMFHVLRPEQLRQETERDVSCSVQKRAGIVD